MYKENDIKSEFCLVCNVNLMHTNLDVTVRNEKNICINRMWDVLSLKKVMQILEIFLKTYPSGDACIMKASEFLQSYMPTVTIPEETLNNVLYYKRNNKRDSLDVVKMLQQMKEDGSIAHV